MDEITNQFKALIQSRCIHFNGMINDTCAAGVNYNSVMVIAPGSSKLPCLHREGLHGGSCDKAHFRSEKESEQEAEREVDASGKTIIAVLAVKHHIKRTGNQSGSLPCPVGCGRNLQYTCFENGHTRGHCDCGINWIE